MVVAGCGLLDKADQAAPTTPAPPPFTPAITQAAATKVLTRHVSTMNLAQRRLSATVAARAVTGSALEMPSSPRRTRTCCPRAGAARRPRLFQLDMPVTERYNYLDLATTVADCAACRLPLTCPGR
jgi:hypothetical protein